MNSGVLIAARILNPDATDDPEASGLVIAIRASLATLATLRTEKAARVTATRGVLPRSAFDLAQSDLQQVDQAIRQTNRALALALRMTF